MNKKLVIFSAFFEPHLGGVERYVKELSLELESKGFEIIIITSDTDKIGFKQKHKNITIYRLKHKFFINGRLPVPFSIKEISYIKKTVKDFQPDAIVMNMRIYPVSLFGAYLAKKLNIKSILIDHVSGYFDLNSKLKNSLSKIYEKIFTAYLKNKVNKFYGVSEKVNEWLLNFGIKSDGVIYNGVNQNPKYSTDEELIEYKVAQDKFTIFFAGRLISEKGVKVLAKAYAEFRKQDTQLIICGDGPLLEELKDDYNYDDIIITGKIPHEHIIALLRKSDVAVIPSFYPEGLPTIILEAGICNCAVLTTDSGGAKEVIKDGFNGKIIEKKSEHSINENLNNLYFDKGLLEKYSTNLYSTINKNFVWSKIAEDFTEKLNKIK